MNYEDFPKLLKEFRGRDSVFRMNFDEQKSRAIAPFTMHTSEAEQKIWDALLKGTISEAAALEELTMLMEQYYGVEYPL